MVCSVPAGCASGSGTLWPGLAGGRPWSGEGRRGVQEPGDVADEQFGVLERRAVSGVGVDDQLRAREVLLQDVGVDRRYQDVAAAIDDQGGLLDGLQVAPPLTDRLAVCLHGR